MIFYHSLSLPMQNLQFTIPLYPVSYRKQYHYFLNLLQLMLVSFSEPYTPSNTWFLVVFVVCLQVALLQAHDSLLCPSTPPALPRPSASTPCTHDYCLRIVVAAWRLTNFSHICYHHLLALLLTLLLVLLLRLHPLVYNYELPVVLVVQHHGTLSQADGPVSLQTLEQCTGRVALQEHVQPLDTDDVVGRWLSDDDGPQQVFRASWVGRCGSQGWVGGEAL